MSKESETEEETMGAPKIMESTKTRKSPQDKRQQRCKV